jgi:hypothetical protein
MAMSLQGASSAVMDSRGHLQAICRTWFGGETHRCSMVAEQLCRFYVLYRETLVQRSPTVAWRSGMALEGEWCLH